MVTSGSSNVSLSADNCTVTLDGEITLPSYTIDVNIPNVGDFCEGINASGSVSVGGGGISAGDGISITGNASGTGNISIAPDGNCGVLLSGSITMPSVTISANTPTINCSDIQGAICDGDLSTTTLSVCDSSGSQTSITVVTM